MSSAIKRKDTARKAIRRIGQCRARKALAALRECETLEAVHEVRKEIKRMRALLRLFRAGVKGSEYRALMNNLRKTAQSLAASRDAFVKTSALAALTAHFKDEVPQRPFEAFHRILSEDCRKKRQGIAKDLKRSRRLLKKICRDFRSLNAKRSGWSTIGCGIKRSYRNARCAYRLADESGRPEHLHEWRKRAKDLLYQIGFLCRIWPEQMNAVEADLEQLGDCLGDAHDLSLLISPEGTKQFASQPKQELEVLKTLADRRQKELRIRALTVGAKFFDEKPAAFCKRLRQYWRRWRQKGIESNDRV